MLAECNRQAKPNLFTSSPASKLELFFKCYGSQSIRSQLERSTPVPRIVQAWQATIERFESARGPHLLYR